MRPMLCLAVLLPLTVLAAQKEGTPLPQKVDLFVGGELVLDFPGVVKVAIGDNTVADVKYLGKGQILLIGASEGETTLKVWRGGERVPTEVKVRIGNVPTAAAGHDEQLTLKIGEEATLTIPGIQRVAVGDAEIADVKTIGASQLLIKGGQQVASTTVIIWSGDSRKSILVHVVK